MEHDTNISLPEEEEEKEESFEGKLKWMNFYSQALLLLWGICIAIILIINGSVYVNIIDYTLGYQVWLIALLLLDIAFLYFIIKTYLHLKAYHKKGYRYNIILLNIYLVRGLVNNLFNYLFNMTSSASDSSQVVVSSIPIIAFYVLNMIYFDKRKSLFRFEAE